MKEIVDKKEKKKRGEKTGYLGEESQAQEGLGDCRKFWRGPKFLYR